LSNRRLTTSWPTASSPASASTSPSTSPASSRPARASTPATRSRPPTPARTEPSGDGRRDSIRHPSPGQNAAAPSRTTSTPVVVRSRASCAAWARGPSRIQDRGRCTPAARADAARGVQSNAAIHGRVIGAARDRDGGGGRASAGGGGHGDAERDRTARPGSAARLAGPPGACSATGWPAWLARRRARGLLVSTSGREVVPIERVAGEWAAINGCDGPPVIEPLPSGARIRRSNA
jgi:hypothetical protein